MITRSVHAPLYKRECRECGGRCFWYMTVYDSETYNAVSFAMSVKHETGCRRPVPEVEKIAVDISVH